MGSYDQAFLFNCYLLNHSLSPNPQPPFLITHTYGKKSENKKQPKMYKVKSSSNSYSTPQVNQYCFLFVLPETATYN